MKIKSGGQRILDLITEWTMVLFAEEEKPENCLGFILEEGPRKRRNASLTYWNACEKRRCQIDNWICKSRVQGTRGKQSARHATVCLSSQPLGERSRRISISSRPAWSTWWVSSPVEWIWMSVRYWKQEECKKREGPGLIPSPPNTSVMAKGRKEAPLRQRKPLPKPRDED